MGATLKDIVLSFIPPIVMIVAGRVRKDRAPPSYERKETFADAVKDAGVGYEDPAFLSKFVDWRPELGTIPAFTAPLFASVAAASMKAKGRMIRVLDFGGASGHLRSQVHTFFNDNFETDWTIVETPSQVSFAADTGLSNVRYSTEIGAGNFDLAIFSGSLHLVEDWQSVLKSVNASMVYIARSPLGDIEQPFLQRSVCNNTPVKYAGRVLPRDEMFAIMEQTCKLVALWPLDHHMMEMGVHEAPAMLWSQSGGS